MEWGWIVIAVFFVQGCISIYALRQACRILFKILVRVELIHEYMLYGKKSYTAEPAALLEAPNARSEAAKRRWAKKKVAKQKEPEPSL